MATVPDYSHVVRDLAASFGPLDTHDRSGAFTELAAAVLHSHDPNFGHLRKFGSQNQYHGHAVDAVLYKATGQAIDLIIGSAEPGARVGWAVEEVPRYTDAEKYWMAPMGLPPGDEEEESPVEPTNPQPVCKCADLIEAIDALSLKVDALTEACTHQPEPVPVKVSFPVYRGRVPTFGGSVTLTPDK